MKTLLMIFLTIVSLTACSKRGKHDACIQVDKNLVQTGETVSILNCGEALSTDKIDLSLNWGDGTVTSGQIGTHIYSSPGTYTIQLLVNDEFAGSSESVDENKVQQTVTVQ